MDWVLLPNCLHLLGYSIQLYVYMVPRCVLRFHVIPTLENHSGHVARKSVGYTEEREPREKCRCRQKERNKDRRIERISGCDAFSGRILRFEKFKTFLHHPIYTYIHTYTCRCTNIRIHKAKCVHM